MSMDRCWEDWKEKGKAVAQTIGQKTGEAVDTVSLKMQIVRTEHDLRDCYEVLGRLHFRAGKTGEDLTPEITAAVEQCEDLNEQLEALQRAYDASRNVRRCPDCDTVNQSDAAYCRICGTKLP